MLRNIIRLSSTLIKPKNHLVATKVIDNVPNDIYNCIHSYKQKYNYIYPIINGKEYNSTDIRPQICPYTKSSIATVNYATKNIIKKSINNKINIPDSRCNMIKIFKKATDLITNKYYNDLIATTMIGQGKTLYQASIDIAELIDFFNFNMYYYKQLHHNYHSNISKNFSNWYPLNGFITAITPFNFTAIAGNLALTPLLFGNSVIWKPSPNAILSNHLLYEIMIEAGLPPKMLQFIPAEPKLFTDIIFKSKYFAGMAFTGSSHVFDNLLTKIYTPYNIKRYNTYPRIVGETGGKNFHFICPELKNNNLYESAYETILGAFEYSGQKCSATSICYVPKSISNTFINNLIEILDNLQIQSPELNNTFTSAVINKESFLKLKNIIDNIMNNIHGDTILYGGNYNDDYGYYVKPTIILCNNLSSPIIKKELFGPILGLILYDDNKVKKAMKELSSISKYKLTGSIFSNNNVYINMGLKILRPQTGNVYINKKCTGAVVNQQPFGGHGKSGTNDKAGSKYFLTRFANNNIVSI